MPSADHLKCTNGKFSKAAYQLIFPAISRAIVRGLFALALLMGLPASSCLPMRPVVKIGLLASFEGLHRRNGYEALATMRSAITTLAGQADAPGAAAVIPLALDAGTNLAQARRAAQKLLADPTVRAVVGPYDPASIEAVRPVMEDAQIPWFLPFALDPTVGMAPAAASSKWASALLKAAAAAAKQQGQERLVLAGSPDGWPSLDELTAVKAVLPIVVSYPPVAGQRETRIVATDALFWLASPETGATYLGTLRSGQPDVPFWLGPWGSDPILGERTTAHTNIYWISWLDSAYAPWAEEVASHGLPDSPAAYLTYRATEAALVAIQLAPPPAVPMWWAQTFVLQNDGTSRQLDSLHP